MPIRKSTLLALALLLCGLLPGCSLLPRQPQAAAPIDSKQVPVLLPFRAELDLMDPTTYRITRRIPIDRFAIDYGLTPNGKLYIPLHENPGDKQTFVGVLDRQSGKLSKVPSPVAAMDMVATTTDGTVFVRSGSVVENNQELMLVMDSKTDTVIGTVSLVGSARHVIPYTASSVLVPVMSRTGFGGNIYVVDRQLHVSEPLFSGDLEPWAPGRLQLKPNSTILYGLHAGFAPNDTSIREELLPHLSDARFLEAHVNVWDLKERKLLRRIFLPVPSAQNMTLGPDGRLYIGHIDMTHKGPVNQISIVEPETGAVRTLETVNDPYSVLIRGDRLYVGSYSSASMDIFHLPDLARIKRVEFAERPFVPAVALPE